jgi:thioredoxin 1
MAQNIMSTSDSNFDQEVIQSPQLTLVDFWAEWCGPCKALAPTLEQIANEYTGKLKIFKLNVDENPNTPPKFSIRGIPTVIFFKSGQVVDQLVGAHPKETFIKTIQKHI